MTPLVLKLSEGCRDGKGRPQRSERTSAQGLALGIVPSRNEEKARGFTARRLRCRNGSTTEATTLRTSRAAMLSPDLRGEKRGHPVLHVGLSLGPPDQGYLASEIKAHLPGLHSGFRVPTCPGLRAPGKPQIPEAQPGQGPRPLSRSAALARASACPQGTRDPHLGRGAGTSAINFGRRLPELPRLRSGVGRHCQEERWRRVTWDYERPAEDN